MFRCRKKYLDYFGILHDEPPSYTPYTEIEVVDSINRSLAYDRFGNCLGEIVYDPMSRTERILCGYRLNELTNTIEPVFYSQFNSHFNLWSRPVELRKDLIYGKVRVYDKITGEYLGEAEPEILTIGKYKLKRKEENKNNKNIFFK